MEENITHPEKKILLISYHFPPSSAVGGLRMAKFARNLPSFDWKVSVLTIDDKYIQQKDSGRLAGLSQTKIIKTSLLPTFNQLYLRIKKYLAFKAEQKNTSGNNFHNSSHHVEEKESLFRKFKRYGISLLLTIPDGERNWIIPAVLKAVKEVKRQQIACIVTTSPPVSVNLIGLLVKIVTGVTWVADFRDPWLNEKGGKRLHTCCSLSLRIEKFLEKKVMQKADSILTTTEILRERYRKKFDFLPLEKFICISNGFEENVFSHLKTMQKYDKFTLTYAGTLYLGRSPKPIFEALHFLIKEGKISPEQVCFKLVGNCNHIDGHPTSEIIHNYELDMVVEVLEPVPYSDVLEIIGKSHLAVLFAPGQPMQIPAKLFDYIGLGVPVIALAGPGASADLINTYKIGRVFDPDDRDGLSNFLLQVICDSNIDLYKNAEARKNFEIRTITKQLDSQLNALVFM